MFARSIALRQPPASAGVARRKAGFDDLELSHDSHASELRNWTTGDGTSWNGCAAKVRSK